MKKVCRRVIPRSLYFALSSIYHILIPTKDDRRHHELKKQIILFLKNFPDDPEKRKVLSFLEQNPLMVFPYQFVEKYAYKAYKIQIFEVDGHRPYVLHEGKRLFFKRTWDNETVGSYYNGLLREQDKDSPHCYSCIKDCLPQKDEAIADIGAAEGIWALTHIDKCKKVYLFECDEEWIEALEMTFEPWKDKVEIVNKFVCDVDDESQKMITLDTFFKDKNIDCIKADIEGAEVPMLIGAPLTMSQKVSRVILCSYHKQNDEAEIREYLTNYRFAHIVVSKGYMIFTYDLELEEPYLRRGLVGASK